MKEDVTLAAGTIVEHYDSNGVWQRIPRITSTGDTGSNAEAKDKTTLEDRMKRYGSGIRDGGDKNFKGQRIPVQDAGSEHSLDRIGQEAWITRCKAEEEMQMRITYSNLERGSFTFKALGYMVSDATADAWIGFSVDGKQNSFVNWTTAPVLTALVIVATGAVAVGESEQIVLNNTPLDAFYEVNEDVYLSDDAAIATVTKWGYVTGIAAGTANITATRKVGDGTTVEEVVIYTVS